jgi:hypothetical protein
MCNSRPWQIISPALCLPFTNMHREKWKCQNCSCAAIHLVTNSPYCHLCVEVAQSVWLERNTLYSSITFQVLRRVTYLSRMEPILLIMV